MRLGDQTKSDMPFHPNLAPVHFITFRNKYDQTGVLDWKGDRVVYSGDLPIDQGTKVRTPSSNHCMLGRPALMEPRFVTVRKTVKARPELLRFTD